MPNYRGHVFGGLIAFSLTKIGFSLFKNLSLPAGSLVFFQQLIFSVLGGLFPDIDIHSKGKKILLFLLIFCVGVAVGNGSYAVLLIFLAIFIFINSVKHRGVTHSPLFVLFVPAMLSEVLNNYAPWIPIIRRDLYIFFTVGALSHIILDYIPKKYLPKSFFNSRPFKFLGIKI